MDWTNVGVQLIVAVTPVATLVILWLLKMAWAKIPASFVLFLTPVVGIVVNFGLSWYSGHEGSFSPLVAAALGMLATVLREWITTLQTKGISGVTTPTKASF